MNTTSTMANDVPITNKLGREKLRSHCHFFKFFLQHQINLDWQLESKKNHAANLFFFVI
jgi:hypothetical protein